MKQKLATAIGITGSIIGIAALLVSFFIDSIIAFIAGTFVLLTSLFVYIFLNILDKGFHFKARIPMAAALSVLYVGLAAYAVVVVVKDTKEAGNMDPGMSMGGDMIPGMDGGVDSGMPEGDIDSGVNGNLAEPTGDNQAEGSSDEEEGAQESEDGEASSEEGEETSSEDGGQESSASDETSGEEPAESSAEETAAEAPVATTAAPAVNYSNNSNSGAAAIPMIRETAVAIPIK